MDEVVRRPVVRRITPIVSRQFANTLLAESDGARKPVTFLNEQWWLVEVRYMDRAAGLTLEAVA